MKKIRIWLIKFLAGKSIQVITNQTVVLKDGFLATQPGQTVLLHGCKIELIKTIKIGFPTDGPIIAGFDNAHYRAEMN